MKHPSWHLAPRSDVRAVNRAEMCRIPLNRAAFAVYLPNQTNEGEAACCCAK